MRLLLLGERVSGFRRPGKWRLLPVFASAMLAACSTVPAIGPNEPPDATDHVRGLDLQPRTLDATGTISTAAGGNGPRVYYGSSGAEVMVDVGANTPSSGSSGGGEGVTLNFEDTPVTAVAKVILGDYLGVGYAIDPRVQGTISLSSGRPVPKSQLLFILESALRTTNAVLVHDAGGYRIVPADDAIGGGRIDRSDRETNTEPGYGVSVVPLQHVSVQTITKLLESFATRPGSIRADSTKNLILVIGNGVERRAAVDTILSFDEDWMRGQSVGIFPVHNSTPEPLVAELEKILDSGEEGLSQHMVKLQPIARMNAVLVVARKPELLRTAEKWINRLDGSAAASTGVKVYKVRYGDCRQIAKLLSDLFIGGGGSTLESAANQIAPGGGATALSGQGGGAMQSGFTQGAGGGGAGGGAGGGLGAGSGGGLGAGGGLGSAGGLGGGGGQGGAGQSQGQGGGPFGALAGGPGQGAAGAGGADASGPGGPGGGLGGGGRAILPGVRILPDVPNNSIVIYANADTYRIIERALNQLDRPQAQVELEVTIAEVTLNNNLSYGVQFFLGSINLPSIHQVGVQAVNTPAAVAGANPSNQPGFNLLLGNQLTPHVIISALNQYTTTKILSNPSLVVLDNQTAAMQVGTQVPITTGSANILNSATSTSNTVFNSISYQNTGIILSFRPHVHANGNVNLEIDQEISACQDCSTTTPNLTPSFTDRHVKSQIQVPNGQTVLLAGLIQEEHDKNREGIPVLEQIPVIGEAFSPTNSNNVARTELIFFIRPVVIHDGVDASNVAEELRSKMRGDKIGTEHPPGAVTPYPIGLVQ
jgi:general secretion pathway protein D